MVINLSIGCKYEDKTQNRLVKFHAENGVNWKQQPQRCPHASTIITLI